MDLTIRLSADEAQTAVESGSMLDLIKVIKHEKVSDNARQITINQMVQPGPTTAKTKEAETEATKATKATKATETAAKPKHSKEEIRALAGPIVRAGLGKTKLRPVLGRFGVNSVSEAGDDILDRLYDAVKALAEEEGLTDAVTA